MVDNKESPQDLEGLAFCSSSPEYCLKLMESISSLPWGTIREVSGEFPPVVMHTYMKFTPHGDSIDVVQVKGDVSGDRLEVRFPEDSTDQRSTNEYAYFSRKDINYKIIY